eukprot:3891912-Pyramimonas_sp.AAC.1
MAGPYTATTKYNLNVYGDTNVGGTIATTTSAVSNLDNLFVEGAVAAYQVIFTDPSAAASQFINLNTSSTPSTTTDNTIAVVFNKYVVSSSGADESYNLMTIATGIGVLNELDTTVTIDGANTELVIQVGAMLSSVLIGGSHAVVCADWWEPCCRLC